MEHVRSKLSRNDEADTGVSQTMLFVMQIARIRVSRVSELCEHSLETSKFPRAPLSCFVKVECLKLSWSWNTDNSQCLDHHQRQDIFNVHSDQFVFIYKQYWRKSRTFRRFFFYECISFCLQMSNKNNSSFKER